jgi:spermidine synthase
VRRAGTRILWLAALFLAFVAVGLVTAARSRTRAALERGDLATVAAIQDRLAWIRLDDAQVRYALAQSLIRDGALDAAVRQLERGLALRPEGEQWAVLAAIQLRRGEAEAAIEAWDRGFQTSGDVRYLHRASKLLLEREEPERAYAYFERAISVQAPSAMTHVWMADGARRMGLPVHQIRHLRAAVGFDPDRVSLRLQLAWVLATCEDPALREPAEAVHLAEALAVSTHRSDASVLDTLAAALAADGRFDDAVLVATEARDLAHRTGDAPLADTLRSRLALYREGRAYVQPAAEAAA